MHTHFSLTDPNLIDIYPYHFINNSKFFIYSTILNNPNKTIFNFKNFNREQRYVLCTALSQLHLTYTKQYSLFLGYVYNIQVIITPYTRLRLFSQDYGRQFGYTFKHKKSTNIKYKLKLSDLIFDIKESLDDNTFKNFMDTLAKIND